MEDKPATDHIAASSEGELSPLLGWFVFIALHSRQQKKAKQAVAERCREFINEEQDHLIQSLLRVPKSTV